MSRHMVQQHGFEICVQLSNEDNGTADWHEIVLTPREALALAHAIATALKAAVEAEALALEQRENQGTASRAR